MRTQRTQNTSLLHFKTIAHQYFKPRPDDSSIQGELPTDLLYKTSRIALCRGLHLREAEFPLSALPPDKAESIGIVTLAGDKRLVCYSYPSTYHRKRVQQRKMQNLGDIAADLP